MEWTTTRIGTDLSGNRHLILGELSPHCPVILAFGLRKAEEIFRHQAAFSVPQARTQPEDLSSQHARVSYGTASLTVRAFYSSSRSYVRIQPAPALLPCGDVQQVTVHYHILASELEDGTARADFYHLVSARAVPALQWSVSAEGPLLAPKREADALLTFCSVRFPVGFGQRIPCASRPNNSTS